MAFHPVYSRDADVFVQRGEDKFSLLQSVMDRSGFLQHVTEHFQQSQKSKVEFLIAIKPNIMTASVHQPDSPVYTDPELVEYLIRQLRQHGFVNIAVVEARNVYDYSYDQRDVSAVAQLAGYGGDGYRLENLSNETEEFDYGGVMGTQKVGVVWQNADYRISFAKNKTHWQCFYTGTMKNIYGCLPEWDKMKHYHGKGKEFYECCVLILHHFPVHFGFLDAWVSGDGFSGHVRDSNPNLTHSIFASSNLLALDWVMGEKMNIDPVLNFVVQEALHRWGTININRVGDMEPWKPWSNVWPFTVIALDVMEEAYWTSRVFSRMFAAYQDKRFPPRKPWQWFFGPVQFTIRLVESIFSSKRRGRKKR